MNLANDYPSRMYSEVRIERDKKLIFVRRVQVPLRHQPCHVAFFMHRRAVTVGEAVLVNVDDLLAELAGWGRVS